jgi:hypothetical protein
VYKKYDGDDQNEAGLQRYRLEEPRRVRLMAAKDLR